MMQLCGHCDLLTGQLATTRPHKGLLARARLMRPYGIIEHFSCDNCGAHFERFCADATWPDVSHFWEIRPPFSE